MSISTQSRSWKVRTSRDLGMAVQELRHSRGLTQAELAEILQMDRTYLSKLEGQRSSIVLNRLLRILRYLGAEVTVTWSEE